MLTRKTIKIMLIFAVLLPLLNPFCTMLELEDAEAGEWLDKAMSSTDRVHIGILFQLAYCVSCLERSSLYLFDSIHVNGFHRNSKLY